MQAESQINLTVRCTYFSDQPITLKQWIVCETGASVGQTTELYNDNYLELPDVESVVDGGSPSLPGLRL